MHKARLLLLLLGSSMAVAGCTHPAEDSTSEQVGAQEMPDPGPAADPEEDTEDGAEPTPPVEQDRRGARPTTTPSDAADEDLVGTDSGAPRTDDGAPADADPLDLPTTSLDDLLGPD